MKVLKTHCLRGHPRVSENVDSNGGCKLCKQLGVNLRRPWDSEAHRAWKRANYKANRKREAARQKAWVKANPEKAKASEQKTRRANPEKYREIKRASDHKREAAKRGNGGSFTVRQWQKLKAFYEYKCLCCGRSEEVLASLGLKLVPDHVLPLSKGGTSFILNIQPLCHAYAAGTPAGCNNLKGAQFIDYRTSAVPAEAGSERAN